MKKIVYTAEEINDKCGFIPFRAYITERTKEQQEYVDKLFLDAEQVKKIIDKLILHNEDDDYDVLLKELGFKEEKR